MICKYIMYGIGIIVIASCVMTFIILCLKDHRDIANDNEQINEYLVTQSKERNND